MRMTQRLLSIDPDWEDAVTWQIRNIVSVCALSTAVGIRLITAEDQGEATSLISNKHEKRH